MPIVSDLQCNTSALVPSVSFIFLKGLPRRSQFFGSGKVKTIWNP